MHRLLRPVSRALRAQGATSCSRHISLALPAQTRSFSATGTTRKNKKMTDVDGMFFGAEEVEANEVVAEKPAATPATDIKHQSPKPEALVAEAKVDEVDSDVDADPDTFGFLAEEKPVAEETLPTTSEAGFNANEYFTSWLSPASREALDTRGGNQYDYLSTLLETEPFENFLSTLDMQELDDFERVWGLYEWRRNTDPQAIVPFLAFLLRRGVLLKAPALTTKSAEDCIASVEPENVTASFSTLADGQWNIDDASKPPSTMLNYPDLMQPDPILDPRDVTEFPATPDSPFTNRVIVRNHRSVFHTYPEGADDLLEDDSSDKPKKKDEAQEDMMTTFALARYYSKLHHTLLMRRRVVHQTGKGKIAGYHLIYLLGDGKGLVGYGVGQHREAGKALRAARADALRNLDTVARFEDRTIWTEMSAKFGATQIYLRPRPVGFGLRCNPYLHQILRAAGFKDISAKVWGSRNKLNVIKAVFRMLHAGHAPTGMGDGLGGKGKTMERGSGMRDKGEIERARGRRLINLRY